MFEPKQNGPRLLPFLIGLTLLSGIFVVAGSAAGETTEVARPSPKDRAKKFFEILANDQQLPQRCAKGIHVGVVSLLDDTVSDHVASETFNELQAYPQKTVQGIKMSVERIPVPDAPALWKIVEEKGLNALFLGPGLAPMVRGMLIFAQRNKILLVATEEEYIRAGVTVGIFQRPDKVSVMIRREEAHTQGIVFNEAFIKDSEIIEAKEIFQPWDVVMKRRIAGRDPEYPKIAREAKLEATIAVKILIGSNGEVGDIKFIKTNKYFEEEIRDAISTWKFSPQIISNQPVATYTVYQRKFTLR
jgi:TonB family protein